MNNVLPTNNSSEDFYIHNSYTFWISRLANLMQEQFNHQLKTLDVTWPQWMVLNVLNQSLAETPAAIAQNIGVDRSAVTRLLDRLENKNLISRHHDKLDRRSVKIKITEQGAKLMDELNQLARSHQDHFMSGLPNTEYRSFKGNIQKMLKLGGVESATLWKQLF
ncbi:MAG: MarR family transcriptional regulator [Cellvibrionaceae bacterium]